MLDPPGESFGGFFLIYLPNLYELTLFIIILRIFTLLNPVGVQKPI